MPRNFQKFFIMNALVPYSIPYKGLQNGIHQFDFQVDKLFFQHFEASPIEEADFEVQLSLDKRPEMLVLDFYFTGKVETICDRCLSAIQLPVEDRQQLIVKFSEEQSKDPAVEHISGSTPVLNVARFIYEYICLAMPISKYCDWVNDPEVTCNEEMLRYLNGTPAVDSEDNQIWEDIKKRLLP